MLHDWGGDGRGPSLYIEDPAGNTLEVKGPPTHPYDPEVRFLAGIGAAPGLSIWNDDAMAEFLTDVETLRQRARENIEQGPITSAYGADRGRVIDVLNEALATELVCILRYKRHYYTATGLNAGPVAAEFLQHANEEQLHADQIALRITQLQGEPNFDPEGLATRAHAEYDASLDLLEMVREDLIAERVAIESYSEIIGWLGSNDPTTRRMLEDILAMEEEHADDLLNILQDISG